MRLFYNYFVALSKIRYEYRATLSIPLLSVKRTTRRDLFHRQSGAARRLQPVGKSGGVSTSMSVRQKNDGMIELF